MKLGRSRTRFQRKRVSRRLKTLAADGDAFLQRQIVLALALFPQQVDGTALRDALKVGDQPGAVAACWPGQRARQILREKLGPRLEELILESAEREWTGLRQRLEKAEGDTAGAAPP